MHFPVYRKQEISCASLESPARRCPGSLLRLELAEDAVGLGAPVGAASKFLGASGAEQTFVGEIGNPGLAFGGALRRPWREPDLAHGFGDLAHFLGPAAAMFDYALEEVGALLLPVDARKSLRQR